AAREGRVRPDHRAAPCALLGSPERAERRDGNHAGRRQVAILGQAGRGTVRSCGHALHPEEGRTEVGEARTATAGRRELQGLRTASELRLFGDGYGCIEPMIFSSETLSVIMPCLTAAAYQVRYQRVASATSGAVSAP